MNTSNYQSILKQELYEAIAYFIDRQHLVAQAMLALGLDLNEVARYGAVAWASYNNDTEWEQKLNAASDRRTEELFEVVKRAHARQITQTGIWQDAQKEEWRYFLHGQGCHLTHSQTQERINWNCPDVLSFDRYFFIEHLEWQVRCPERGQKLANLKEYLEGQGAEGIIKLIEVMIEEEQISREMRLVKAQT